MAELAYRILLWPQQMEFSLNTSHPCPLDKINNREFLNRESYVVPNILFPYKAFSRRPILPLPLTLESKTLHIEVMTGTLVKLVSRAT